MKDREKEKRVFEADINQDQFNLDLYLKLNNLTIKFFLAADRIPAKLQLRRAALFPIWSATYL